jgi:DNA polymerase/3'-5' exonuclease PolX
MNFGTITILLQEEKSKYRKGKRANATKAIKAAYDRAIDEIEKTYSEKDMATTAKVNSLDLTDHMKKKICTWISSGRKPKELSKTEFLQRELTHVMGIGKSKATELIEAGLTNINQLKRAKWKDMLSEATRTFLELKPNTKIARKYIACLEEKMRKEFTKYQFDIVGSYRREAKYSGDIDIIIYDPYDDSIKATKALRKFLSSISDGDMHVIGKGGTKKVTMIINLNKCIKFKKENPYVQIDVFFGSPSNRPALLLYGTGSKALMIQMRSKFKKGIKQEDGSIRKYKLDQFNLWDMTDPSNPDIVPLNDEKKIFELAGMDYLEPKDRSV